MTTVSLTRQDAQLSATRSQSVCDHVKDSVTTAARPHIAHDRGVRVEGADRVAAPRHAHSTPHQSDHEKLNEVSAARQ